MFPFAQVRGRSPVPMRSDRGSYVGLNLHQFSFRQLIKNAALSTVPFVGVLTVADIFFPDQLFFYI